MSEKTTVWLHNGGVREIDNVESVRVVEGVIRVLTARESHIFPLFNVAEVLSELVE